MPRDISTGFIGFDRLTGGLGFGDLFVIGGRTAMGKTSLALNIVEHVAVKQKKPVLVFTLGMTNADFGEHLLLSEAHVDSESYRTGAVDETDMERIVDAASRLVNSNIFVHTGDSKHEEILKESRDFFSTRPDLGMIVVDSIQDVYSKFRTRERTDELSRIVRDMKVLAKDLDVPIILTSQVSRLSERTDLRRCPVVELKDCSSIEQHADIVAMIYRPEVDDPNNMDVKGLAEIEIVKNRHGRTGIFFLYWLGSCRSFENAADVEAI